MEVYAQRQAAQTADSGENRVAGSAWSAERSGFNRIGIIAKYDIPDRPR
jgi:hypothetical protein